MQKQIVLSTYVLSLSVIGIFIYCGLYVVPSADDYFYANLIQEYGLIDAQIAHYIEWSGRYTATFFITLFSLTRFEYYWITPLICISSLFCSFYFFLKTISFKNKNTQHLVLFSLSVIALFLSITTAGYGHGILVINEGFFWLSGALTYSMALSLYLILISCLMWLYRSKLCLLNYFICQLLLILVIGLNETAMFMVCLTILPVLIYQREKFGILTVCSFVLVIGICCCCVVFAPGNDVRMGTSSGGNIFSAIGICFEKVIQIFFYYLFNPFIWLFTILFHAQIETLTSTFLKNNNERFYYNLGAILVFALYFPVAYSLNSGAPDRLIAFIGFFAFLFSIVYSSKILHLLIRKIGNKRRTIFVLILSAFIGSYYFVEPLRIGIFTAFSGPAFYQEHEDRKLVIAKARIDGHSPVYVNYIKRNPLLLFEDLLPDSNNVGFAKFHGVKSVRVLSIE